MLVAEADRIISVIALADRIKPEAQRAIADLAADGIEVIMASGDSEGAARAVGKTLGIARAMGGMSPEDKHALVETLKRDISGVMPARRLARATLFNIKQNLGFAFGYNALGIPIAAGVPFPLTGWLLSPMLAAAAMSLSSASVIGNALRLNATRL